MMGNNLNYYRKKFKITQKELAERIGGYSKQHISSIENNKVSVSTYIALKIVKAIKEITLEKGQEIIITVDDLFYLQE